MSEPSRNPGEFEPDRMLCERCACELPTDRMWKRICWDCLPKGER